MASSPGLPHPHGQPGRSTQASAHAQDWQRHIKKSNGNINVLHVLRFLPLFSGAVADVFLIRTGKNVASASQLGVIYVYINCIMFHRAFPILDSDEKSHLHEALQQCKVCFCHPPVMDIFQLSNCSSGFVRSCWDPDTTPQCVPIHQSIGHSSLSQT